MQATRRDWSSAVRAGAAAFALAAAACAAAACDMPAGLDETRGEPYPTVEPREEALEPGAPTEDPTARPQDERDVAESKASIADLEALREIASLKEDADRITVTLAGSELFAPGESALLSRAEKNLDRVGDVFGIVAARRPIVVEGHTDSQGRAVENERLSQARADAVRERLIARGLDGTKVRAVGKGESEPIADNATPEGRAQNRRVELEFPRKPQSEPFAAR